MQDYILLMHDDTISPPADALWEGYFAMLNARGAFKGGSSIGSGETLRKGGEPGPLGSHLSGFIRVQAADLAAAKALVKGNPVYEAGGTVEVRELPRD